MPKSKSKRKKVLDHERRQRRSDNDLNRSTKVADATFNNILSGDAASAFGAALAVSRGYTPITLEDLPEDMRAKTAAAMHEWEAAEGVRAQLYRKPDGDYSIMAAAPEDQQGGEPV